MGTLIPLFPEPEESEPVAADPAAGANPIVGAAIPDFKSPSDAPVSA